MAALLLFLWSPQLCLLVNRLSDLISCFPAMPASSFPPVETTLCRAVRWTRGLTVTHRTCWVKDVQFTREATARGRSLLAQLLWGRSSALCGSSRIPQGAGSGVWGCGLGDKARGQTDTSAWTGLWVQRQWRLAKTGELGLPHPSPSVIFGKVLRWGGPVVLSLPATTCFCLFSCCFFLSHNKAWKLACLAIYPNAPAAVIPAFHKDLSR